MFGFGKKKAYHDMVWLLLNDLRIDAGIRASTMLPINSLIENSRLQQLSEHEAALALGYSVVMNHFEKGRGIEGTTLLGRLNDAGNEWVNARVANFNVVEGFRKHVKDQIGR